MRKSTTSRFPWRLWRWTGGSESLFDLNPDELAMFREFVSLESLK